ncbi:uncharacterized membrane protein YcaP (DUF421 family) [Cytobacillus firmus]|uniref:Uncharacterized membrane protein YcaP (DUF421 family) n=2 Tax=Cytobacillus TaxID=2675230 RepID=A0A366K6G2_CYTFI|nr:MULTISPECIES: YetF domain-containing protein [Cytobacillus]RBP96713.1 uncharacterized membrane protein YcaP (DUF421 family) [Cytobacillus firmus]TDX45560.1 uncharacterized membrane protein YcaP (DUF421 family) [Cytobacillus oceanisediminis]
MDLNLIWQTLLIFLVGNILLRISGRRSISQMTIPQTVIMIGIGTLLIQPVTGKGLWATFGVALILILSLIVIEYIQLKFDGGETIISGKAVPVIENGTLNEKNLQKLRLPVDKLEARLRQSGISSIGDVEFATIESSGQMGYILKPQKQPATKEDIQNLIQLIQTGQPVNLSSQKPLHDNIFIETVTKNSPDVPKHLQ